MNSDSRPLVPFTPQGRLVASLAHEIKNSTQALMEIVYLLKTTAGIHASHPAQKYLIEAEDEVHRIAQNAHALIDSQVHDAAVQDIDIPRLLNSVVNSYKSRLELRHISVLLRFPNDGNCPGQLEPLRQVFSTLLMNAVDAVSSGGKIHVRARRATQDKGTHRSGTRITIGDNGRGIPAADLPRIWEPFFSTKGTGGMGIGLSLVRKTVQEHQGAVRVRSSTKQGRSGTVFTIFLPAAA